MWLESTQSRHRKVNSCDPPTTDDLTQVSLISLGLCYLEERDISLRLFTVRFSLNYFTDRTWYPQPVVRRQRNKR